MLAQKYRLKENRDFRRVKDQGKLFHSTSFSVCVLDRKDNEPSRYGFVVTSKVLPNASKRTVVKRALSEGIRINLKDLRDGYDVVFLAKTAVIKKYTSELMVEAVEALKRAGIGKNA